MMNIQDRIRSFWDSQPCGTTHVNLPPHSRDYFVEFDKFYESYYPYLLPYLSLEAMQDRSVLEIGLGSGFTLHRIAQVAESCLGLDVSHETLRLNQARAGHFDLRFKLLQASAAQIPLADNSFDFVVSIGCLHHIPDIERAAKEIHRVLKPGGIFKGMVYNRNSYRYRVYIPIIRRFSPRWRGSSKQDCVNKIYDGSENPYGMVYSKREIAAIFNKFKILDFRTQNFVGQELLPRYGDRIPRNLWLTTMGRLGGLDQYFTARAIK